MAKFTRPNLPRGTKLALESVFDTITAIKTALNAPTIDGTNLRQKRAGVRVNLMFPQLDGKTLYNHAGVSVWSDDKLRTRWFGVPFVLPPLAEDFDATGAVPSDLTPLTLDEVSFSFDQAALGAFLVSNGQTKGTLTYESAPESIKITLLQKRMFAFGSDSYEPETTVFSGEVSAAELLDPDKRANPKAWVGLNRQVDPYQSFMLHIECPGLAPDANGSFANKRFITLPSTVVSLRFVAPLVERDRADVQNAPTLTYATDNVSTATPTADSLIAASGSGGVNTNLQTLSDKLISRLRGSLRPDGGVPGFESRKADAVYDVIAVPLWQNVGPEGYIAANNAGNLPHVGATPFTDPSTEEVWIPITNPFVVHHVFAANSIAVPKDLTGNPANKAGQIPTSATLNVAIGVGLHSGVRADDPRYQQVAYAAFTAAQRPSYVIDRMRVGREQEMSETPSLVDGYTHGIMQVPVVGTGRDGFYTVAGTKIDQGNPVFVGRGGLRTQTRSNIDGGAPNTGGAEQFLVVRWQIRDSGGLAFGGGGAAGHQLECYSGIGGSWVFVVGKRHLVGTLDNRRM